MAFGKNPHFSAGRTGARWRFAGFYLYVKNTLYSTSISNNKRKES
jgi:hypothetical protein